nr:MAG TPA: hypothetical protein [Caudoviricetes sp.]
MCGSRLFSILHTCHLFSYRKSRIAMFYRALQNSPH